MSSGTIGIDNGQDINKAEAYSPEKSTRHADHRAHRNAPIRDRAHRPSNNLLTDIERPERARRLKAK
jgi:hypothetical protein